MFASWRRTRSGGQQVRIAQERRAVVAYSQRRFLKYSMSSMPSTIITPHMTGYDQRQCSSGMKSLHKHCLVSTI
jgi:hypothetical protein